ncbi:TfoX/Sxy family DNA transformation protein [Mesobacterium pallidum]|uniref:TfoX/Sxy family DNA transformation protein n=1 Tax=Mesobacterium pallidum TaxID=2872037 RepID=UPI001EE2C9A4|nr:TfoX/Sxy family DNA transformation protein [Mesobacterium pallidum]
MTPVSSIPNLGPKSEAGFARAGMHSAEDVRALGADAAYAKLLAAGTRPHFIGYYALVLGLQGRPWTDATVEEKAALRLRFDALKSGAAPDRPTGIEKFLDEIGVRPAG